MTRSGRVAACVKRHRLPLRLPPRLAVLWAAALVSAFALPAWRPLARETIEARLHRSAPENSERRARLQKLFEEAGCGKLADEPVAGSELGNLVCRLPGETEAVIAVGAHFDRTGAGEGVVDNWTGAALLPSLYEAAAAAPRRHTFLFLAFTDEEKGLVGSEFYASRLPRATLARLRAVVNLDSLGLGPTRFWKSRADPRLAELLLQAAAGAGIAISESNVESLGTSDSEPFARRRVPAITLHSVTRDNFAVLHSARDVLATVSLADYHDSYRLLVAYLELLDVSLR